MKEQKAKGLIANFELQPKYELIPAFTKDGKKYRPITYSPDFIIYHNDGTDECIDVKSMGTATQQGVIRRKLFDWAYQDIKLTWVCRNLKHGNADGWVLYEDLKAIYAKRKKEKQ